MPSRDVYLLHKKLTPIAIKFTIACTHAGVPVLITNTFRSYEEQNHLYASGRTIAGKILTNARGGQSKHNFTINGLPASKAFDVALMRQTPSGFKAVWFEHGMWLERWETIGKIGESLGLEWGGRWEGRKCDKPHFQLPD